MWPPRPPSALLRAGAITVAKRIGVSSGTAIWRGLCAVSAARRFASVTNALADRVSAGRRGANTAVLTAVAVMAMVSLRGSGGVGDLGAGEPQVDVVERGRPGHEARGRKVGAADGADHVGGRPA